MQTHGARSEFHFSADIHRRNGFEAHVMPGQGSGLFATRNFLQGELMLVDLPLLSWPVGEPMTRQNAAATIDRLVGGIGAGALAHMSSLVQESGMHGNVRSSLGVWQSNALPSHEDGGASLYADACLINHSCSPSLEQGFDRSTRAQRLHVTRPSIACGEHLSIAYEREPGTRDERRQRLRNTFGFDCSCELCSLVGSELEQSDRRQQRMSYLRKLILEMQSAPPLERPSVVTAVDEMLSLQRHEGLPLTWGQEYMIIAIRELQTRGDEVAAGRFAWQAAEATRIGGHGDAPIYEQLVKIAARSPLPLSPTADGLDEAHRAAQADFDQCVAAGGGQSPAEQSSVHVLRGVLSATDIAQLHEAAAASLAEQKTWPRRRRTPMGADGYDVRYSEEHVLLFLHLDRFLERSWPALYASIVGAMRAHESAHELGPLNVRCIELHKYMPGGGVVSVGHRDMGSSLTMSVQLSEPCEMVGGGFVTWSEGNPVAHQLARGDAVLFRSEKVHNVARLLRGVRRSLVVELWSHDTNTKSRYG